MHPFRVRRPVGRGAAGQRRQLQQVAGPGGQVLLIKLTVPAVLRVVAF